MDKVEPSIKHSSSKVEYNIGKTKLSLYTNRGAADCANVDCRLPIQLGDRVVSCRTNGAYGRWARLYHKECALKKGII